MKNYHERELLKGYDAGVAKSRLIEIASKLEDLGFKRDAKTLFRIVGDLENWQHK